MCSTQSQINKKITANESRNSKFLAGNYAVNIMKFFRSVDSFTRLGQGYVPFTNIYYAYQYHDSHD